MAEPGGTEIDEALLRRLEEQLAKTPVSEFLLQACATLSSIGFVRMQAETRDLAQARLAIDAIRALAGVLETEGAVPPELSRDLKQAVAQLQLTFAGSLAAAGSGSDTTEGEEQQDGGS